MSAGLAQPDCVQTTFTDRPVAPCVLYQSIVPTLTAYPATVGSVKCKAGATDAADCADFEPPPAPPGPLPPLPPPPPAPPPAVVTPLWDAAPLLASGVRAIPTYLDQVNAFTMARGSKLCKDFDIILLLSPPLCGSGSPPLAAASAADIVPRHAISAAPLASCSVVAVTVTVTVL